MNFTPHQLDAVDVSKCRQDTCVVAGPGSGKTSVLVEFYRRLVMDARVPPSRILAITFTEKAARNMKERLAGFFRGMPESRRQLEQANVSTIHGFCARLLRENSIAAGIDPQFRVLDARQSVIMQRQASTAALDALFAERPEAMRRLMRALRSPELAGEIPGLYDAMRAGGICVQALRDFSMQGAPSLEQIRDILRRVTQESTRDWLPAQRTNLEDVLRAAQELAELPDTPITENHFRIRSLFPTSLNGLKKNTVIHSRLMAAKKQIHEDLYRAWLTEYYAGARETLCAVMERFDFLYSERKRGLGALDFADLEAFAVQLLEQNRTVRDRVRDQFLHVLMDEFQDTNAQQAKLVDLLRAPDRFYSVGDINQSIYGFRHANPGVFRAYRDAIHRSGKHLVELVENWRSRPDILRAFETIVDGAAGIEPRRLVASKDFPDKLEPSVEIIAGIANTQEAALNLEAQWVARRILELAGSLHLAGGPARFGDFAVLVRNTEVLPAFTRGFEQAGVPYLLNQGRGFFETREAVDLTHLLRVISNPRDEISLAAVLRSPFAAVSDEALFRLKQAGNLGSALRRLDHLEAEFSSEDLEKLRRFREQLRRWRESRETAGFDRLLMRAMDETGYPVEPASRAAANIEKFLAMAREACARLTLPQFVEELEWMREADARDVDVPPEDTVNAVRIMTVHAAKGLEFPVVFLAALHKGVQTDTGPVCFSPQIGLGARWIDPSSGKDKGDWFHAAIREEAKRREEEESNRLFYVAMTRAEEHLVFSYSSFGKKKEWAAMLEGALGLDLSTPLQKVQLVEAPDGEKFLLRTFATNAAPEPRARTAPEAAATAVETLARPPVSAQHDFAASVTSVALFAHCPRRYYLERYLGWPGHTPRHLRFTEDEDGDEEMDASEFGLAVHALLAGNSVAEATGAARKLAEAFHASDLGRRAARASRVEREFDFLMAVEDVVLRGQIDLWFEEGGELVLVDYKTDDIKARDVTRKAEFYAPQLRLYALALEGISKSRPVRAFIYFLRPNIPVPVAIERTLLENPEDLVREFREAQSAVNFPLREGEHCESCPYFRGLCPAPSGMADIVDPPAIDGEDLAGDEAGLG